MDSKRDDEGTREEIEEIRRTINSERRKLGLPELPGELGHRELVSPPCSTWADQLAYDVEKLRVHDGDLVHFKIGGVVTQRQIRAFREHLYGHAQRCGWEEKNILWLVTQVDDLDITYSTSFRLSF